MSALQDLLRGGPTSELASEVIALHANAKRIQRERDAAYAVLRMWKEEDDDESRRLSARGAGGPSDHWYVHYSIPFRRAAAKVLLTAARAAQPEGGADRE